MHRSRHSIDASNIVDDDNDDDLSHHHHHLTPSTTRDYSSLIVNSSLDTVYHRTQSPSPSPTSSISLNNHRIEEPTPPPPSTSSSFTTNSVRYTHRRLSHSSSLVDLNGSSNNIHRDRLRFNTWPRHRKEKRDVLVDHDKNLAKSVIQELGIGVNKTYRNPWGNLSYAQLITRAIDSSPWKRLTLNEVYEWIIKFVPYFKDKVDPKTSWGWKNSIRHNLSLHKQFIRVRVISSLSKGPVKYVWTINPAFKNNSPYKKYSLKRKRAAEAAAVLTSQAAAAEAVVSHVNSTPSSSVPLSLSQDRNSSSMTPTQPLVNMSNNYRRQSATVASLPKATRFNEHTEVNNSSPLNQLPVAAGMVPVGVTDPAAYGTFLNPQATTMLNKHKPQTLSSATPRQLSPISHRPTQTISQSFTHDSGLPVPKKLALAADRCKQQQQQQQRHAEWLLPSYQQRSHPYNSRHLHRSGPPINQQCSLYLPPPTSATSTRCNSDINNLSSSLQRRISSPPAYSSAVAAVAQTELLARTKRWHDTVQAVTHDQQNYHHQQQLPSNAINELRNYIHHSNTKNENHNRMSQYLDPETRKFLSSSSSARREHNSHEEQHAFAHHPSYKLTRASYPNTTTSSMVPSGFIQQRTNQNAASVWASQRKMNVIAAAYDSYRRLSSRFSSTSHGGPSDDEIEEYIASRKDSSTSVASSGYESGLAPSYQSPPISSIRTESGSSITSETSSSSCHYTNYNGTKSSVKHSTKINSKSKDNEMNDDQKLALNSVGGYVDDLMERIRKMPPKKRSKFYQMLDEERLKDVNNNSHNNCSKSKTMESEDDENKHQISIDVPVSLTIDEMHSDDEDDGTFVELAPNTERMKLIDDSNDEKNNKLRKQQLFEFNEKNYEELRSMGIPLSVLKAIAFQQHQQTQSNNINNNQITDFLTDKCTVTSTNSPDTKSLLNARTILRRILQEHQKKEEQQKQQQQQQQQHSAHEKILVGSVNYTIDEGGAIIEDDANDEHQSSLIISHHRNGLRSNGSKLGTVTLNPNNVSSSLSPTSTSPDETNINHQESPTSLSRPSSTPATLIRSGY